MILIQQESVASTTGSSPGARLDNLVGTFTAIQGLIASLGDERLLADDVNIRMTACFDNEEVGGLGWKTGEEKWTMFV
ncbi:hypothetical protein Y032_0019g3783 [Ancylostoma ceylanicum]|uniref:Uncharacterized protein n=1 Tax=Ancylostoma ceylanicum TaxID=53326 RepID=A0A016V123_9BILA|nr:hypothetical protein Y032_0019g3783 [Ancylostoma ceylanicum]